MIFCFSLRSDIFFRLLFRITAKKALKELNPLWLLFVVPEKKYTLDLSFFPSLEGVWTVAGSNWRNILGVGFEK